MLDDPTGVVATDTSTRQLAEVMAVRTRFFDDFFLDAARAGIRQAVILASGLDSRAYRLPWPADMIVFEIDQPEVIDFKTATLAAAGATPTAGRNTVAVDLREDWPAALRVHGFDPAAPTAWSAEGLLLYLPADAQNRLFDYVTELSAPGSRLATEDYPDGRTGIIQRFRYWSERWAGLGLNLAELIYVDDHQPVVDYLDKKGWQVDSRTRKQVFAAYDRPFGHDELSGVLGNSLNITATRR
jgi:methyltransferase (TIGR00027 family)